MRAPFHPLLLTSRGCDSGLRSLLDDGAGDARARIAGGLCLVVIRPGMHDETASDDARRARIHRHHVEHRVEVRLAARIGLDRRHVAGMTLRARVMRVLLAERIEMTLGAHAVAGAAVAGFMDMEA